MELLIEYFMLKTININDSVFLVNDNVFKPLRVLINLDLGIETCFYNGMDGYAKMFLYFFPFLPLNYFHLNYCSQSLLL